MIGNNNPTFPATTCLRIFITLSLMLLFGFSGCVSVPPQVANAHQKELEIIESLRTSHMAMVDSYVNEKISNFDHFFFKEYGPAYLKNWQAGFKTLNNRDYNPAKDFPVLYSDLVAEYQELVAPIEQIREELKTAIATEYSNAIAVHQAVGRWLNSLEKLNKSQSDAINSLLAGIKPGLSLKSIDDAIEKAKTKVKQKLDELT